MDVWSHDRADHLERLKRLDGMKEKNKATGGVCEVMGNLRFPLDKTYHGCPYLSMIDNRQPYQVGLLRPQTG